MAWFRCFIRDDNFPGQLIGQQSLIGFYVTRFVQAADLIQVEAAAIDALRTEPRLARPAGEEPSANARIFFEEIVEIPADAVPCTQPGFVAPDGARNLNLSARRRDGGPFSHPTYFIYHGSAGGGGFFQSGAKPA
jgi:hypothetical protein